MKATSLPDYIAEARTAGCDRLVLSSEYLSLYAPRAVRALMADLRSASAEASFVLIKRPAEAWVKSLFNQYIKTVDGGPRLENIDAFVQHVLRNRAIDVARRVGQWHDCVDAAPLAHYHLDERTPDDAVLRPFEAFCGLDLAGAPPSRANASVDPARLYAVGQLRQQAPSPIRNAAIAALLAGRGTVGLPPSDYLEIGAEMRGLLEAEVMEPLRRFPWRSLTALDTKVAAA